ncbi:MAG: exopolysaccharide biosynthesis polyprenyl glycosylphosphotransferase [Hyphomonadaceae bacterium]|nr:exopolysaccharide biosynthesis polyprenyl glycosylphosphotransferase [Hyphomonadaceae bacterium]
MRPLAPQPETQAQARRTRAFPEFAPTKGGIPPVLTSRLLAGIDWTLLAVAFAAAAQFSYALPVQDLKLGAAISLAWVLLLLKVGLWLVQAYAPGAGLKHAERALGGLALGALAGLAASAFFAPDDRSAIALAVILPVTALAMTLAHAGAFWLIGRAERAGANAETAIIVGATAAASRLITRARINGSLRVVAVVDDRIRRAPARVESVPVAGNVNDLMSWERLPDVDRIIVAFDAGGDARARDIVHRLRSLPQRVDLAIDVKPQGNNMDRRLDAAASIACISGGYVQPGLSLAKRAFDVAMGALMLCAFMPLMTLIAIAIKLDSRGPVLFMQSRHGLNNRVIKVFKFRTMRHEPKATQQGVLAQTKHKDPRITRIGGFLRATSLDELPQLFNVLKGDMSLVGPRPHAINMRAAGDTPLDRVTHEYAHRHRVRPGLTGWAQVNGSRGPIESPEAVRERVRLDLEYIHNASVWLDLWIMMRTVPALLGDKQCTR